MNPNQSKFKHLLPATSNLIAARSLTIFEPIPTPNYLFHQPFSNQVTSLIYPFEAPNLHFTKAIILYFSRTFHSFIPVAIKFITSRKSFKLPFHPDNIINTLFVADKTEENLRRHSTPNSRDSIPMEVSIVHCVGVHTQNSVVVKCALELYVC